MMMAPSIGYLALTRKSYENTTASHEVTQWISTEMEGYLATLLTTCVLLLVAIISAFRRARKNSTLGVFIRQVCILSPVFLWNLVHSGPTFQSALPRYMPAAIKIKMKRVVSISSEGPCNSIFLLTASLLMHSWISVHLRKLLRYIRHPPAESTLVMAPSISQAVKMHSQDRNSFEEELRAYIQQRKIQSAGLPTDQPLLYSLMMSGPS
jgi:hypothetical protein